LKADQFKKLLEQYANGTASEKEKQLVEDWYASYNDELMENFADPETEGKVKEDIKAEILAKRSQPPVKKLFFRKYYKYAAVLALAVPAVFAGRSYFKKANTSGQVQSFTIVETKAGEYKKVKLEDESIIQMNPLTRLRIPGHFDQQPERIVYLDGGEAFFEVSKDPQHPFIVKAQQIRTRVLGTKFAVSLSKGTGAEISVSEGKVEVGDGHRVFDKLTYGKRLNYYLKDKKWKVSQFPLKEHNAWYVNVIRLRNASFAELSRAVKTIYGIKLSSRNRNVAAYVYNLHIRSTRSFEETLKVICSIHKNKYRRTKNGIEIY